MSLHQKTASLLFTILMIASVQAQIPKPPASRVNDLRVSPVALPHVLALDSSPFHHKDPFDRLLIAQCLAEGLTIVTADSQFSAYSVKLLQ